jgi:hypothetical protein
MGDQMNNIDNGAKPQLAARYMRKAELEIGTFAEQMSDKDDLI